MGRESRANPRSTDGGTTMRSALEARVARFCDFFEDRSSYLGYLDGRDISESERAYLDSMLPERLQAPRMVVAIDAADAADAS